MALDEPLIVPIVAALGLLLRDRQWASFTHRLGFACERRSSVPVIFAPP
jgi:hypothetical protein